MLHIISDIKKYFLVLHIVSMIILNTYELKNIFNKKKDSSKLEKELKNIRNIEGLRDYTKILYDLVTLNIISLLSIKKNKDCISSFFIIFDSLFIT